MGINDGSIMATFITTHMPRKDTAVPSHVWSGIRIHIIDIVQPPGIGISRIADIDAHPMIVAAPLAVKSSPTRTKKARCEGRSETIAIPRLTGLGFAFPKGGLAGVRHLHPFRVGRGVGDVAIVPVPTTCTVGFGDSLGRVLPHLLTP